MENLPQTKVREILEGLRSNVAGVQVVLLLGPQGLIDHIQVDLELNFETIVVEYGMLLRIAGRTSADTGAGELIEQIVVSGKSIMIARSVAADYFLILLSSAQDQIGRARYELKQAAWEIQKH